MIVLQKIKVFICSIQIPAAGPEKRELRGEESGGAFGAAKQPKQERSYAISSLVAEVDCYLLLFVLLLSCGAAVTAVWWILGYCCLQLLGLLLFGALTLSLAERQ